MSKLDRLIKASKELARTKYQEPFEVSLDNQETKDFIVETILRRLRDTGIDANGNYLITDNAAQGEVYSYLTIQIKAEKGQKFRNVTLQDTGEFYDSFDIRTSRNFFKIVADFAKRKGHISENFTNSYPSKQEFEKAIAALSDKEFKILIDEFVRPRFNQAVKNFLRL